MKVGSDLRNVYIWGTAREYLAALALTMMVEGKVGRKQAPVSLGDAASLAILEACERRGVMPGVIGGRVGQVQKEKA